MIDLPGYVAILKTDLLAILTHVDTLIAETLALCFCIILLVERRLIK